MPLSGGGPASTTDSKKVKIKVAFWGSPDEINIITSMQFWDLGSDGLAYFYISPVLSW